MRGFSNSLLSSTFGYAMTRQRKPQVRLESIEETSKLNNALAVLAAYRRDAILEAVAMSAKELLRSSNLEQSLPKVIEQIGQATGVDRVHIIMIDPDAPVDEGRSRAIFLECLRHFNAAKIPRFKRLELD
jgi:hypothetical protein